MRVWGGNPWQLHQTKLKICAKPLFAPTSLIFCSGRWVRNVIRQAQDDENTGSITTGPLSNIRLCLSAVWTLGLTTGRGEGRAAPDSPARPSQPPELIEKTWSPGPSCVLLADPSPPLPPSLNSIILPDPASTSSSTPSCIPTAVSANPRQSAPRLTALPQKKKKKCNPHNSVHGELMCSFTYRIDPISAKLNPPPVLRWIHHSFAAHLKDITWYRRSLLGKKVQWAPLTW